jgi:hypothetical protein
MAVMTQPIAVASSEDCLEEGSMATISRTYLEDQPSSPTAPGASETAFGGGGASFSVAGTAMKQVLLLGPVLDAPAASLSPVRAAILEGAAGGAVGAAHRRQVRRQTARERFALSSSMMPGAAKQQQQQHPQQSDGMLPGTLEQSPADGESVVLLPVEVVLDQATISVPYDESPMRIYELSEVWEDAVKQVHLKRQGLRRTATYILIVIFNCSLSLSQENC